MKNTSKKIVAGLMVTGMLAALALPTFAQSEDRNELTQASSGYEGNTTVNYTRGNTYIISVPMTLTLSEEEEITCEVTTTAMNIAPDKTLKVYIKGGKFFSNTVSYVDNKAVATLKNSADSSVTAVTTITGGEEYNTDITSEEMSVAEFKGMSTDPTDNTIKGKLKFSTLTNTDTGKSKVQAGDYSGRVYFVASVE